MEFIPLIPEVRVTPFTQIRRERRLPLPGDISAVGGMRVGALDVLARAYPPKMRRALSLTRVLGVREADVPKRLLKQVGDLVDAREIIIAKPINFGIQRLVYRAPDAGQITAIQGSWMILDLHGEPLDLPALYRGLLVEVLPNEGGIVEAQGALIQGAWGSGRERVGVLKLMVQARDQILDAEALDVDARGAILVAGGGVSEAALRRADQLQASGIVTGSLDPRLRELAEQVNVPVLITDGFGTLPMSTPVFDLLTLCNGQEGAVNARYVPRGRAAARPELFVPRASVYFQKADESTQGQHPEVKPGALVRGASPPYLGRIGKLPQELTLYWVATESGARVPGVEVEWQDPAERAPVAWTNLELVG